VGFRQPQSVFDPVKNVVGNGSTSCNQVPAILSSVAMPSAPAPIRAGFTSTSDSSQRPEPIVIQTSPILGIANSPKRPNTRTSVSSPLRYLNLEGRLVYAVHLRAARPKFGPVVYQPRDVVLLIDAHTGRWIREV
jgi:hypothetical protein